MLNVPKKANDAMHLSLLEGCDVPMDKLGEVILQENFQVWDPKQIIRKARDRHVFLFEQYLLFSKEVKDASGKAKYMYKNKLLVSHELRMYDDISLGERNTDSKILFAFIDIGPWRYGVHRRG